MLHTEIQEMMKYIRETDVIKFGEIGRLKESLDQCLISNLHLNVRLKKALTDIDDLKEESRRIQVMWRMRVTGTGYEWAIFQGLAIKFQQGMGIGKGIDIVDEIASRKDSKSHTQDQRGLSDEMTVQRSEIQSLNDNLQWKQVDY